jgi:hypothetical protein
MGKSDRFHAPAALSPGKESLLLKGDWIDRRFAVTLPETEPVVSHYSELATWGPLSSIQNT